MTKDSLFEVGDDFLQHVYRLTLVLAAVGVVGIGVIAGLPGALSFLIGSLFSLGVVLSIQFLVRRIVRPGSASKAKHWLAIITLGKYVVFFVGLYFLMKADWLNIYALAAGIGLVQLAIILKAIKLMISILLKSNESENH